MSLQPLYLDGRWMTPTGDVETFPARSPHDSGTLAPSYPVSEWDDLDRALTAASGIARELAATPAEHLAGFLETYADGLEASFAELAEIASLETGLPVKPRLLESELPRTVFQLRQSAEAAREQSWRLPTIDTAGDLRSCLMPLAKPVLVIGPNNFPFAYNAVAGGDFAAAIATGHPVVAKAHPAHPGTTLALVRICVDALARSGLPPATLQFFYHCENEDGTRLAGDARLGALAFTGSRPAGRQLKEAADAQGTPVYLELGSINPVFLLGGALRGRPDELATAFTESCLQGNGQFCTNPGLVLLEGGEFAEAFVDKVRAVFVQATSGPMLVDGMQERVDASTTRLRSAGARRLARGRSTAGAFGVAPELLRVDGADFLRDPDVFQEEMFGPVSLLVVASGAEALEAIAESLGANLTASFFSGTDGRDDALCERLAAIVGPKVGRLLNDKMPTGVAVSPAMVHGGPFPAGSHPGFTAVGAPATLRRFGALRCFDHVRAHRLPAVLQDRNPTGRTWRCIDGKWTHADVSGAL